MPNVVTELDDDRRRAVDWVAVCRTEDVPDDGGACVLYEGVQIAVFHVASRDSWFAVQNRCPHWNEMVLSRGMTGQAGDRLKIACPMHKRAYDLSSGDCLDDDSLQLTAFKVKVVDQEVFIARPSQKFLEVERSYSTGLSGIGRK